VKLTLTASRLLETLLRASEGILSREKLLTMVWDDYGLQASNSSLNQYISISVSYVAHYLHSAVKN
ncbi:winged helix-turn-helix domain-containing protein, partial [Citrobacter freundii]|uniref:winged helix-turn-helix domain-containing protein n=2 Tax=Enterobacteriaceae TaxID=543 RepID=UPI001FFDFFF2